MYNCERFLTRDIAVYILPKAKKLSMSITIGISANSKPYTKLITTASPFITGYLYLLFYKNGNTSYY